MSAVTATAEAPEAVAKRRVLFPSIISGLVVGLVAAIVTGIIVHALVSSPRRDDDMIVAAYIAWFVGFLVGIGAATYPARLGVGGRMAEHEEELELAGKDEGVWRYFRFCTDHKVVGIQYMVLILVLFLVGGAASWMIRLEQARSGAKVFTPATYNTLVGMHGIIMIATTIIMVSAVFGNYLLPIMIGAKDMAFPRLNALSFWTLFAAVPVLLSTIVLGGFPTGWTGYSPLADQAATGMDAYCFTILVFAISITLGAINVVVTTVKMRAPGMTWSRLPMFVWGVMFSTFLGLLVFPTFMAATVLTLADRTLGTSFYEASLGGNNFLYEQLFWFMGHPEVYVIALPGMGVIAEIVTVFTRKPLFGRRLVLGGMVGIFALSLVVWMHHIYWSGANTPVDAPIMLDTELISIPTGVVFFALIGTFWRGRVRLSTPMLFSLGFVVNFIIGGCTGLYLADVPTDALFHGDMFVVAHFHFTLVGGAVFGFLAGLYYWFPKMTGRQLNEGLGKLHFWLFEIGFVGVFMPLFFAGLKGEPRWQAFIDPKFATLNLISSLFAIMIIASVAVFAYNILYTWIKGPIAAANPWGGRTLEWMTPNPVPLVNFELPIVVNAGPYDYGVGGERQMGRPVMAGGAIDGLTEFDAIALAQARDFHGHEAAERPGRARLGVLLWIASDLMFELGLLVGFIYLSALNTQHAFHPASEPTPSQIANWLLVLVAVAGAATWTWGYRGARAGNSGQARSGMTLGWILTVGGLITDIVLFAGLKAPSPLHAYASGIGLFTFYHAWHLIIGLAISSIVLLRLLSGKLSGHEHLSQLVGYWLWWAAAAAFLATGLITLMG